MLARPNCLFIVEKAAYDFLRVDQRLNTFKGSSVWEEKLIGYILRASPCSYLAGMESAGLDAM